MFSSTRRPRAVLAVAAAVCLAAGLAVAVVPAAEAVPAQPGCAKMAGTVYQSVNP